MVLYLKYLEGGNLPVEMISLKVKKNSDVITPIHLYFPFETHVYAK